jgi:dynein heavy chain
MFEMHCEELIKSLVKRADVICGKLIAKMFRDHQEVNTMYGSTGVAMFAF